MRRSSLLVAILFALLSACSSTSGGSEAGADVAADEAQSDAAVDQDTGPEPTDVVMPPRDSGDPDASTVQCNTLENDAPPVTIQHEMGVPPVATGGMIADGRYHLSRIAFYNYPPDAGMPPMGMTRGVMEVMGSTMQFVGEGSNGQTQRGTLTYTVMANQINLMATCPMGMGGMGGMGGNIMGTYSASPTSFSLFFSFGGTTIEQTFTRR